MGLSRSPSDGSASPECAPRGASPQAPVHLAKGFATWRLPRSAAGGSPSHRGCGRARLSPSSPSRSQPRCSISTVVAASPRAMNRISTSVASTRSRRRCHMYPSRVGGSQIVTSPQSCSIAVRPSARRSGHLAGARGRRSRSRFRRDRVVGRPPRVDPGRPDLEGTIHRAWDLELEANRLDHWSPGPAGVFAATSRNRAAASPQTRSSTPGRPRSPRPGAGRSDACPAGSRRRARPPSGGGGGARRPGG